MEGAGDETARVKLARELWDLAINIRGHATREGWLDAEVGSWDSAPSLPIVTMLGLGMRWCAAFPKWSYPKVST